MKKVYIVLTSWRFGLHWFYYQYALNKETIDADLNRNLNQFIRRKPLNTYKKPTFLEFCFLMTFYTMFRNIFYARVANRHRFYAKFLSFFCQATNTVRYISYSKNWRRANCTTWIWNYY